MTIKRATPVGMDDLRRMSAHVNWTNPVHCQTWLLFVLARDLLFRGGHNMLRKHVKFTESGQLSVLVFSKGDSKREPKWRNAAPNARDARFDTPQLMREYLHSSGIHKYPEAPLFARRNPDTGRVIKPFVPLAYSTFRKIILKRWTEKIGIAGATPGSFCPGGLTDAIMGGAAPLAMRGLGWRGSGNVFVRYLRPGGEAVAVMAREAAERTAAAAKHRTPTRVQRQPSRTTESASMTGHRYRAGQRGAARPCKTGPRGHRAHKHPSSTAK